MLEEIRENDHNLNIRQYADTSPPPEPFDVRGILHGGVPIKETQDEYIQEILAGFDVSAVLVQKDVEYLKFRDDIREKSQIRQHLRDTSDAVIQQFECQTKVYFLIIELLSRSRPTEIKSYGFTDLPLTFIS